MTEILGERRFKELITIYYHLIKCKERVYINTLSGELGIDEDTLKLDIEYLNKKGYEMDKINNSKLTINSYFIKYDNKYLCLFYTQQGHNI